MPPNKKNCDPENCTAMPQAELESKLDNILVVIKEVKGDIKEIKEDSRSHYKSIIEHEQKLIYLNEKIEEEKTKNKEQNDIVHEKFRRSEKNTKWWVMALLALSATVSGVIQFFMSKPT